MALLGEGVLSNYDWPDFISLEIKFVATGWILFGILIVLCCAMKIQSVMADMPGFTVDPYRFVLYSVRSSDVCLQVGSEEGG